jgi:hypothetical protein
MQRRSFLWGLLVAPATALAGLSALLQACAGDSETPATAPCDGEVATMDLHIHPTCLSQAVQMSPQPNNILSMEAGSTGHTHTVTLTDAQVNTVVAGGMVTVTSSMNGHTHQVTFG